MDDNINDESLSDLFSSDSCDDYVPPTSSSDDESFSFTRKCPIKR